MHYISKQRLKINLILLNKIELKKFKKHRKKMKENYDFYKKIVENPQNELFYPNLWDLVVISAISNSQKLCYEKQIEIKLKSGKLPRQFRYLVINDPDDRKIGSGGSTLNIIKELHILYKEKLNQMKIMVIHAGGYR
jgi:hypothetical protein